MGDSIWPVPLKEAQYQLPIADVPLDQGEPRALEQTDNNPPSWDRLQMKHQQRSLQTAGWIKQVMEESDAFDSVSIYAVPLAPLMGADLPAVLLEVGCIHPAAPPESGELERQLDGYAESIAKAIDMAVEEPVR